jgi:hypothetical protein
MWVRSGVELQVLVVGKDEAAYETNIYAGVDRLVAAHTTRGVYVIVGCTQAIDAH